MRRLPKVELKSDGTQDVMIVRVTTDAGIVGYGEAVTSGTVVRAIIVDTSASMARPSLSSSPGARLIDDGRLLAARLASEATESLVMETATPARAR